MENVQSVIALKIICWQIKYSIENLSVVFLIISQLKKKEKLIT